MAEIYPDQDDKEETVVQTNIYLVTDNRTPMKPNCAGASSVLIITDCRPLASGILSLKRWERDGWVRSKGRPIKRKEKWERVAKALQGYQIAAQVKRVDLYEDLLRKGECDER